MTSQPKSQCSACARFVSPFDVPRDRRPSGPTCAAFPAGISDRVYRNVLDHRQPIQGDGGIRWESNGEPFPEWALASSDSA